MIINGTLGLSSHSGIHGNNNANIVLQHLNVEDFESTGIQLNGVHNAFIDCANIRGIPFAPLQSLTFSFLQHKKKIEKYVTDNEIVIDGSGDEVILNVDVSLSVSLKYSETIEKACIIYNNLLKPFTQEDEEHKHGHFKSVSASLQTIWKTLLQLDSEQLVDCSGQTLDPTNVPHLLGQEIIDCIKRYVMKSSKETFTGNDIACPDGSAMYGILIHQSGVAIGELADACTKNGGPCCPVVHGGDKGHSCSQTAECVTIHNCNISQLLLNSHETIGLFDVHKNKFIRETTGAVLDFNLIQPGQFHEVLTTLVNITLEQPWSDSIRYFLMFSRTDYTFDTFLDNNTVDGVVGIEFRYNIDIMAHVSKGVFGIRVEDTTGLSIENINCHQCQNLTKVKYNRSSLPSKAILKSHIVKSLLDQVSDYAFGGTDLRGIFIGNCKGYLLTHIELKKLYSFMGLCQGVDLIMCYNGNIHGLQSHELIGVINDTLRVHHNCSRLYLRDVKNEQKQTKAYRAIVEEVKSVVDKIDSNSSDSDKDNAFQTLTSLLRIPYVDNHLLAFETPSSIQKLQLC